jgi:RNA polymerase sigma factor for flagellar operon FliA
MAVNKLKKYIQYSPLQERENSAGERERLVTEYAPLVKTIAGRLALKLPKHISMDDLISAGIMGLLDAIEKFNKEKGVEFRSYAEFRVRGAMIDELRAMDWVPRSIRKNTKRLEEAYTRVEREKMRPAKDEEVAEELGLDLEAFYRLLDETKGVSLISEEECVNLVAQDGAVEWKTPHSGRAVTPLDSLRLTEVREVISESIERLPTNEQTVVALYYYEELTMKEIGEVMGYTESRVSQLHTKAVIRLRSSLRGYFEA